MEFETVKHSGRLHVIVNGVESEDFAVPGAGGCWLIYQPIRRGFASSSLEEALVIIALGMDTWYTAKEAAERLVELGAYDIAPSAREVCGWARNGLLPGAIKVSAPGRGGSWRIPEAALREFKGSEKKC